MKGIKHNNIHMKFDFNFDFNFIIKKTEFIIDQ